MMKKNLKQTLLTALIPLAASAVLMGCSTQSAGAAASKTPGTAPAAAAAPSVEETAAFAKAAGSVLLSVNPEIEIEYDGRGLVTGLEGKNDDGKTVVSGYEDYQGKECRTVVSELVREIYESGYFDQTVGGHEKNIVVKLTEGSADLDDDFLEDMAEGVRQAVKTCNIDAKPISVSRNDLDSNGLIGLEKAKEIVLSQLGLTEADFTEREYELDDGVYELEFTANGVEYEYEVNAFTGKVLEADREHNDDWDHFDDDRFDDDDDDDRWDDDRFDDDDDDRWDDDRFDDDDDDRWDDDRFEDDDDDDRWDDDRFEGDDDDDDDDDDDRWDD